MGPEAAASLEDFHYAVVKCACGYAPGDHLNDREAVNALIRHINAESLVSGTSTPNRS